MDPNLEEVAVIDTDDNWEWSRGLVAAALDRGGTLLDVGCGNGLLMESLVRWAASRSLAIAPYGLDIAPALAELARRRLPHWAERIFIGNALGWQPPCRFDFVRTRLEYVPPLQRRELVAWLLEDVVAPGGRLIIGKFDEEVAQPATAQLLSRWGFHVAGCAERAHRSEPRLAYRVLWVDAPRMSMDDFSFRSLCAADLPLMQEWLARPHVNDWWHQPLGAAEMQKKYFPRISGAEPTHLYIIEHAGRPIGWIQWYRWEDYPAHATQLDAEPQSAGLDLAIGELELLGRGLGPRVIRAFAEHVIFADPSITACLADPEEPNARSIRAFEKAGFTAVRTVQLSGEKNRRRVFRITPDENRNG